MSGRTKAAIWGMLVAVVFITLAFLSPIHSRPNKAHPQRITAVNVVRSVSLTITNASALPTTRPASGK